MDELAQLEKRIDGLEWIVDQHSKLIEQSAEKLAELSALVHRLSKALSGGAR
jgi:hypothetical protein